jgi:hypothetical protein
MRIIKVGSCNECPLTEINGSLKIIQCTELNKEISEGGYLKECPLEDPEDEKI